jgi:hypothetical protein
MQPRGDIRRLHCEQPECQTIGLFDATEEFRQFSDRPVARGWG